MIPTNEQLVQELSDLIARLQEIGNYPVVQDDLDSGDYLLEATNNLRSLRLRVREASDDA